GLPYFQPRTRIVPCCSQHRQQRRSEHQSTMLAGLTAAHVERANRQWSKARHQAPHAQGMTRDPVPKSAAIGANPSRELLAKGLVGELESISFGDKVCHFAAMLRVGDLMEPDRLFGCSGVQAAHKLPGDYTILEGSAIRPALEHGPETLIVLIRRRPG